LHTTLRTFNLSIHIDFASMPIKYLQAVFFLNEPTLGKDQRILMKLGRWVHLGAWTNSLEGFLENSQNFLSYRGSKFGFLKRRLQQ
jgi:hypothetical protein